MPFKQKLHAHSWFILINALIAIAIACRYYVFLPEFPSEPLGVAFILAGTFSQMVLLAGLIGLIALPALFLPKRVRNITQAVIASLGIAVLFIDTIVFAQYRFHINAVVLDLVLSGQVVSFPLVTWITVLSGVFALLAVQFGMATWLERDTHPIRKAPINQYKLGSKFAWVALMALLVTNSIHIWAAANVYQPVTMVKRYLPIFHPATANSFMEKRGWIDLKAVQQQKAMRIKSKSDLNYPLNPVQFENLEPLTNILLVVVDSWRADTFNSENTPYMWKYAQNGVSFQDHIATGNATRTGIFGLFYGLPGTYWHGFHANQQSPVLVDRLQELDYQLGLFSAARLTSPEFHQTVFVNVPDIRVTSIGRTPSDRDKHLTEDWMDWYDKRDKSKPAFSFLFYDAPHGYDFPADFEYKYEPMIDRVDYLELNNDSDREGFINRYKTSVRYVDTQVKRALDKLKAEGDLENTLVIITGDHSQEMNDNKLNFWGHNGNFTRAQTQVPFVMFGPGVDQTQLVDSLKYTTSHEDLAPTLMRNYLGATSDIHDYATGVDLYNYNVNREWVMTSSYSAYGIIYQDTIVEVNGAGQSQIYDSTYHPKKGGKMNYQYVHEALEKISRFRK
ncbi:choline-sulfatase [Vibrionales bacterium C3R12]|nr:choline-sulfatase [Vibrionales bacterium C3R12]